MEHCGAGALLYQNLFWSSFNSSDNVSHRNCHCCSKIYLTFHRISWLYKYSLSTLIFVDLLSMCLITVYTPCILDWQSTSLKQNLRNYRKSTCWIKEKRYKPTVNTWWMEGACGTRQMWRNNLPSTRSNGRNNSEAQNKIKKQKEEYF